MSILCRPLHLLVRSPRLSRSLTIFIPIQTKVSFRPASSIPKQPEGMASIVDKAKNSVAENFGGIAHSIVSEDKQFSVEAVPDLSGKVAVVTGGSEGIGYACTHTLLSRNAAHVYILSMSKEVVDGAVEAIRSEMGDSAANRVTWFQCDLGDWPTTASIASKIASKTDRLDILINNAARGIMTYELTDYGVDRHMAVNHIGHVILTSHLLPTMKATAEKGNTVRIVNLASNAHELAPSDTKFASLDELNRDLGPNPLYGRAKLATLMHMRYLARHLTSSTHPNILANATHPGFVDTKMSTQDIHEPYPLGGYAMSVGMAPLKKDQFMGAVSTLFAATKTEKSGQYICPPAIVESGSELSRNEELQEQLMKLTREIVKEKYGEESVGKGCPLKDY